MLQKISPDDFFLFPADIMPATANQTLTLNRKHRGAFETRTIQVSPETGHAALVTDTSMAEHLSVQAEHFDSTLRPLQSKDRRWPSRHALVARQLANVLGNPSCARVLDVGCGPGPFLAALPTSWDLHGLDIAPSSVARAQIEVPHATLSVEPIETYQGIQGGFDAVTAFALIEHLLDPAPFLRECARLVRPGGIVLVMTGDTNTTVAREMGDSWPLWWCTGHAHFFTAQSLQSMLRESGLNPVKTEWRAMLHPGLKRGRVSRVMAKVAEITGQLDKPTWDHVYCYARRPE